MKYLNNLSGWRLNLLIIGTISFIISVFLLIRMEKIGIDFFGLGAIFVMPIFKNIWLKLTFCILCKFYVSFFYKKSHRMLLSLNDIVVLCSIY